MPHGPCAPRWKRVGGRQRRRLRPQRSSAGEREKRTSDGRPVSRQEGIVYLDISRQAVRLREGLSVGGVGYGRGTGPASSRGSDARFLSKQLQRSVNPQTQTLPPHRPPAILLPPLQPLPPPTNKLRTPSSITMATEVRAPCSRVPRLVGGCMPL